MSSTREPCLVCGTVTGTRCGGCKLRYYCGTECQEADWKYHVGECQTGEINAFWGIGKWKDIVDEHMRLMISTIDIILKNDGDLSQNALDANKLRWKKGKSSESRDLQTRIDRFNTAVLVYARDAARNDTGRVIPQSKEIKAAAESLATFFKDKQNFGTVWSSNSDYDQAWSAYALCFREYIDRYNIESKKRDDAYFRKCTETADGLGAVLNGRPWR